MKLSIIVLFGLALIYTGNKRADAPPSCNPCPFVK